MSRDKSNLILTGFMGTGKSTVGRIAAERLGFIFVDTDKVIEQNTSKTINDIFAEYGEKYFRQLEKEVIKEYSQKREHVIAVGGGAVLDPENIRDLKLNGLVMLLKARPDVIYRNVCKDKSRPLLQCDDPMGRINELLEARRKFYEDCHYEIDVSDISVQEAVEKVIEIYRREE